MWNMHSWLRDRKVHWLLQTQKNSPDSPAWTEGSASLKWCLMALHHMLHLCRSLPPRCRGLKYRSSSQEHNCERKEGDATCLQSVCLQHLKDRLRLRDARVEAQETRGTGSAASAETQPWPCRQNLWCHRCLRDVSRLKNIWKSEGENRGVGWRNLNISSFSAAWFLTGFQAMRFRRGRFSAD